jgi:hypothetical protein
MSKPAKLYGQTWDGELLTLYGRHEDGSETAIVLPPGALAVIASTKPAQQSGEWTQANPLPVDFFDVGHMPIEGKVALAVNTSLGPPLRFSCSPEQAQSLAELLLQAASDAASKLSRA